MSERQSDSREFREGLDRHLTTPDEPSAELTLWGDAAQFEAAPIEHEGPRVHLVSATPDPLGSIAAMCRMYEGKPTYSLADVTDDERRHYWEEVQKTHLKAPLEAVDLHFFIEGVDRSFTHQIVRQRTAVYAQESLRFAVKENLADEIDLPPSIVPESTEAEDWEAAVIQVGQAYTRLVNRGVPAEDARGLLPHATRTRLNYKTSLRGLLEHAGNRLCTQAQFVWRAVFLGIVKAIAEYEPDVMATDGRGGLIEQAHAWQFRLIAESDAFAPVCYSLGRCPFQADFDRGCTIRSRVEEDRFDLIEKSEWLADPNAGRTHAEDRS